VVYTSKLGVAIISFDRPYYLQQLLASLERNTYLHDTDFHVFQDGAVNKFSGRKAGDPANIGKAVDCARRARLPNKHFHIRSENVSIGIQQFEAYQWMTERYGVVLVLEDDIVVSPYYLRVMRVLLDSIADMDHVFSASSNFVKEISGDISGYLNKMVCVRRHWWGEIFPSSRWARIRPYFLEYYELIKNIDYAARPVDKIQELFERHDFGCKATSQDAGKDMAVTAAGMDRVRLAVNRAIYVGQQGVHCDPTLYRQRRWGEQEPYVFPEDETIDRFEMIQGDRQ